MKLDFSIKAIEKHIIYFYSLVITQSDSSLISDNLETKFLNWHLEDI